MRNFVQTLFLGLFWVLFVFTCNITSAQINEGGTPPSFLHSTMTKQAATPMSVPIDFDVNKLKDEDRINETNGSPMRMAKIIPVSLSIDNAGNWTTLPSGEQIWQLTVHTPKAIATLLYYDEFYIPKGAKLFIYNKDKSHVLGAYTNITNPNGGEFATEFVSGDVFTLEYVMPVNKNLLQDKPRIKISGIAYGYNHLNIYNDPKTKSFGDAESCMVNINCSEGDEWQDAKKGVVRIITPIGTSTYYCGGTIVNNTANDFTPYFLSAHHCFYNESGMYAEASGLNRMMFYFNFEHPDCETLSIRPQSPTMTGAQMLVDINIQSGSDGVLLKLNQNIPLDYNVYYNGWDNRNTRALSGAFIHHPGGDVKKISTYTSPLGHVTWDFGSITAAENAHWEVHFAKTVNGYSSAQKGSSGAPLFNQNKLVVGTLTGGNASCSYPNGIEYFGKFSYHWDQSSDPNKHMKKYLDPLNSGQLTLTGCYATINANFSSNKTSIFASEPVRFESQSYGASTYLWSFPGGTPSTSTEKNPLVSYNTAGNYSVTLTINKGQANEQTKTVANYITCTLKTTSCYESKLIGKESGKAQFPLGILQRQSFSSSIYQLSELGGHPGKISKLSWYAGKASSIARTIIVYIKETNDNTITPAKWADEINGLTPVYKGPYFTNIEGWNEIQLTLPFAFSGTKNLKILVQSITSNSTSIDFASSDCYYSIANNMHMEWTTTSNVVPGNNGTVTSNRPNIKVTFENNCVNAPIANFIPKAKIISYQEDFETVNLGNFPPNGWKIKSLNNSASSWRAGSSPDFGVIDPNSLTSAVFITSNAKMDAWLISPIANILTDNAMLDFYVYFDPRFINQTQINLYLSDNDEASWTQIWTTGSVNDNTKQPAWVLKTIDLSEYNGKALKFAWQYVGTYGAHAAIDGVKVYSPNKEGVARINEGDEVSYTDLSTGPVVLWDWTFEGGTPATSTDPQPIVQYYTNGVYKTTLTVKNTLGTHTKTFEGAVIVTTETPVAKFSANGGYMRKSNSGRFISVDGLINLIDASENKPTSWLWTAEGASISSPTEKEPSIRYSEKGIFDISLKASNKNGSNTLKHTQFIKVGDTDSIWNIPIGDNGTLVLTSGENYLTGTNKLNNNAFSERFGAPQNSGIIKQVRILFDVNDNSAGMLNVSINNDDNGVPGKPLATVALPVNTIKKSGYTEINFPEAVVIPGAFHIVVSGFSNPSPYFNVAIKSSALRTSGNTSSIQSGSIWTNFTNISSNGLEKGYNNLSLNIVPIFTYTDGLTVSQSQLSFTNSSTTGQSVTVTTNIDWSATTIFPWIVIENNKGIGNGSFTIKCINNTKSTRTGSVIVQGGGFAETIIVKQAARAPGNLTASLTSANNNHVQLAWTASPLDDSELDDVQADMPGELYDPYLMGAVLMGYQIYRNGIKIAETSNLAYVDETAVVEGSSLCYTVKSLFENNDISDPSNEACVFITIEVTGVQLSPTNTNLAVEETVMLIPTFSPSNASDKTIKSWFSSNPIIAQVDENGKVTAKSYGTAIITATTNDGNFTAEATVVVDKIANGSIKASEAFSPNGDGINDYFIIQRIEEHPDNELVVFDRNGTIHYYTKSYNNNWDGIANRGLLNGKQLPADTYFFRLKVKDQFDIKSFVVIRY